jgi:hypothetical protein
MDLNKLYDKIPDEILSIVESYIRPSSLIFLNNNYYNKYHYLIKYLIPKNQFENYIRNIIRRDYDFVFQQILNDNFIKWLNIKQYIYKNITYKNYLYFLSDYCIHNNSVKCRNALNEFLKEHGLCQNRHKKNTFIHIRWKT